MGAERFNGRKPAAVHAHPRTRRPGPPPRLRRGRGPQRAGRPGHDRRRGDPQVLDLVAIGLVGLVALIASRLRRRAGHRQPRLARPSLPPPSPTPTTPPPSRRRADRRRRQGVAFEKFEKVDPTLPPVPAGAVKKFKVDVYQYVTQVSKDLAPTEVWSFAVNGKYTAAPASRRRWSSPRATPSTSRSSTARQDMKVDLPHSLDFHSAEVNPARATPTWRPASRCTTASSPSTRASSCTTAPRSRC